MDILITLPKNLIDAIISGVKTIEMRRVIPKNWAYELCYVFIAQKGSGNVVALFRVKDVEVSCSEDESWLKYGEKLGITREFHKEYWGNRACMNYIFIRDARFLSKEVPLMLFRGGHKAPQNFCYV